MIVRWTDRALYRAREIYAHITAHDHEVTAIRTLTAIEARAASLDMLPNRGVKGRSPGTFELILTDYPYIIVYAIVSDEVHILSVEPARAQKVAR